jgi:plastocyanin|tara:strand:- start:271 stop:837 length:567 start_codon:yes stop_codon:yes gene_type:complete
MKKTERAILTVFVIGLLLVVLRALVPAEVVVEPVIDNTAFREEIVDEVVEVERPAVLIPQEVTIEIIGFDFVPSDIIISPGTTVTWKNLDNKAHKVVEYKRYFYGERMELGDTYSFTFDEIGVYTYFDANFPKLGKGKITVQNEPLPITGNAILMDYNETQGKNGAIVLLAGLSIFSLCSYIKKSEKR